MATFTGTAGNDTLTGTSGNDDFILNKGGEDTATGLGGDDTFKFNAALDAGDSVDGGTGFDQVFLRGDYSAGLTFGTTTLLNIERIVLGSGFDYDLTSNDATVAAGAEMTVNGSALGAANTMTFDGSAETNGHFILVGGAGNDSLTGGAGNDTFDLSHGGEDTATGGAGKDVFIMGAAFDAGDRIDGGVDGGDGKNVLRLDGNYAAGVTLVANTIQNIESFQFDVGHNYKLTVAGANFVAGQAVFVDASLLGSGNELTFDGSAADPHFKFTGGAGNDVLTGGSSNDIFDLKYGGNDTASGGGGHDVFEMGSTFNGADRIDGGAGDDTVELTGMGGASSITFGATTMVNVETLLLDTGHNYTMTTNDATVAAGATLLVRGENIDAGHSLVFNGAAETDGSFIIRGGAGNDTLTGGAQADTFNLLTGGNDKVHGGGGDDTIAMGATLTAADCLDGGAGNDTVTLNGDYSAGVVFGATTLTNVETLSLAAGHSYNLTTNDANVAAGATLTVDGSALGASDSLVFNGAAETDGKFAITGGAGDDFITLSTGVFANGAVDGGAGADTLTLTGGTTGLTVNTTNAANVETIALADGASYTGLAITGGVGGNDLTVDASALSSTHTTNVDLTGDTASNIEFLGGGGDDTVTFDQNFDQTYFYQGGGGFNTAAFASGTGNSGNYWAIYASYMSNLDKIVVENSPYQNFRIVGDPSHNGTLTIDASALSAANGNTFRLGQSTVAHLDITDGAGNDIFLVGSALTAGTTLDAGGGNDTLDFGGTRGLVTDGGVATLLNFEKFVFDAGYNYAITVNDATVASGQTLTVDASALASANSLTFDGSAETNGNFAIIGGAGNDVLTVGAAGGSIHAGAGNDTITDKGFTGTIDGGAGNDTLVLNAPAALSDTNDTGIDTVKFVDGGDYFGAISIAGDITSGGGTLLVDASAISDGVTLNLSGVTTTTVDFTGGAGDDTVIFSSDNDNWGTVNGGGGNNTFEFNDGSAAIVDGASVTNFSTLSFADGHDYSGIYVTGDITGGHGTLSVDASAVSSGHSVDVDLSGVTSSGIDFTGGAGDDTVVFGANLANVVSADGGAGNNTLELTGNGQDVTTTFSGANLANFSDLALEDGNNYDITVTGGFGGETGLNIEASALSAQYGATIDMSGLTNFSLNFTGGAGDDTVLAGAGLGNMTIDGGGGNDVLKLDGDYSAGITLSSVSNISEIDLAGGNSYNLTTTDATVAAGATLTVDASALGINSSLTFDGSAETDGYFDIKGGAGDDSLTLQTLEVDNSTIDGGAGFNSLTLTGSLAGDESFNAASITHIDDIAFAAGSDAGFVSFTGDITGDGSTLTVNETNADGAGGSGPDGDMLLTDISALTGTIDLTGGVIDDYVTVSSENWTSLNGNGGNYNAINVIGAGPITFDAATITGFNALVFANPTDYTGITVVGDLTGNGGTLDIDATYANSISIDVSQATSVIDFAGSAGDDTIVFGNNFTSSDIIAGNGGNDTLSLGRNTATLADTAITGVSTVTLSDTSAFAITGDISGSGTLTVDASALIDPHDQANINFSLATTATINFTGGVGNDTVVFGSNITDAGMIDGGAGDDVVSAGISNVTVDFSNGGNDSFFGGTGNALIEMGGALDTGDQIYGSGGPEQTVVSLDGDYSAGITLSMLNAVNEVELGAGHNYNITLDPSDTNGFLLDGSSLGAGDSLTADASPVTSGDVTINGGAGNDTITVGSASGGISAGAGDDTIIDNGFLGSIDGGAGNDTLVLHGGGTDLAATLSDSSISNIQNLSFDDGNNYDVTITGDITSGGGTLTIDAGALTAASAATVDVSGATTAAIDFTGGAGDDTVIFGTNIAAATSIDGGGGNDTLVVGQGGTLSDTTISHIENVDFSGDATSGYDVSISGDLTSGGGTLSLDASQVQNGGVTFDLTGATATDFNIVGSGGADTVILGPGENLASFYSSGNFDTLELTGGSTGLTLDAATIVGLGQITFADGASYTGIVVTGDITNTGPLTIDASALTGSNSVDVDASQAASSLYFVTGGAGDDTFVFGGNAGNVYSLDGGSGINTLELNGHGNDVNVNLYDSAVQNIENIVLDDGNNYDLTLVGEITSGHGTLSIDAGALSSAYGASVNATSATTPTIDFTGGAGDDFVAVGSAQGTVDFTHGGDDTFQGWGFATVEMGGALTAADSLTGAAVVSLDGDYSAGLTLAAATLNNIGTLSFAAGHDYNLTTDDGNVGAGQTMTVDGSALGAGDTLTFDGSAETDGSFAMIGGAGNDSLTGGAQTNTFDLTYGGADTVHGGSASDFIYMGDTLDTGDRIDGGGGFNYVFLEGDSYGGGFNLSAGELTNINYVKVLGDHTYVLTGDPAALNSSDYVTIDGGAMTGGSLQFDGSAVTDGAISLYGGAGDDILKGGSGNDTLDLSVGGEDQLAGNGGNDIINAGGGLDAGDQVDGGAGTDTLNFAGDYSAGLVLGATTVANVETFHFAAGYSYNITTNDATVAAGATLTVNASALGASDQLIFNGSAETDGSFVITGGAGNDVLTGGAGNDIFHLADGGDDTVQGGAGNDIIYGETGYSSGDMIDGGTGANVFFLGGKDYTGASAVTFTAANFVNIQTIDLNSSHSYSLTMNDANVPAGATMLVDGHLAKSFTFDGSAETDGHFTIVASTGADVLAGGALSDTFVFDTVSYSTSTTYDAITNLNFSSDILELNVGVYMPTAIDAAVTSGSLSTATFNSDLTSDLAGHLAAHHAVLFTADSGTLSGHTFLVVDANGTAGYQASADYVIDVTGYTGTLTTGSFT
ncbi:MAG TPA: calcium-binding protein [Rhizomicrobium sp.]|nr:calcium-binding protein [Rhizomicrobium sp.]